MSTTASLDRGLEREAATVLDWQSRQLSGNHGRFMHHYLYLWVSTWSRTHRGASRRQLPRVHQHPHTRFHCIPSSYGYSTVLSLPIFASCFVDCLQNRNLQWYQNRKNGIETEISGAVRRGLGKQHSSIELLVL